MEQESAKPLAELAFKKGYMQKWSDGLKKEMLRRHKVENKAFYRKGMRKLAVVNAASDIVWFCNNFCWTYDPRFASVKGWPSYMPFTLWEKQAEYLRWLEERVSLQEEFLVEKSRDVGISWLNCVFALHKWMFHPGWSIGFGSANLDKVDKIGDPNSILEKIRIMIQRFPLWLQPRGWEREAHHKRIMNPENGCVIIGEGGDNIGRGGRSTVYFLDEAAHIEHPEKADAATVANTDIRGWVSSVYGAGGVFAQKRFSNLIPVFTFHYKDDPRKDEDWVRKKRRITDPVTWAAEYEIDYHASVPDICIPMKWVYSAQRLVKIAEGDLTKYVEVDESTGKPKHEGVSGLDVAAGGKNLSVHVSRFGPLVRMPTGWEGDDTKMTADRAVNLVQIEGSVCLNYDSIGVGAGVTSRLREINLVHATPINVGSSPTGRWWADSKQSTDKFVNLKAELWWTMRERFRLTYEHVCFLDGDHENGQKHPVDELISIPEHQALATQLSTPKAWRQANGKIVIESKKELERRGVKSPDFADALALTFAPTTYGRVAVRRAL